MSNIYIVFIFEYPSCAKVPSIASRAGIGLSVDPADKFHVLIVNSDCSYLTSIEL